MAVRSELARRALPLFLDEGFDSVTFDVLAKDAGVSRSTYLRYFPTKEDVVLYVFDPVGDAVIAALGAASARDSEWLALRHCLNPVVDFLQESDRQRELMRLVWATPDLYLRLHQKQAGWQARMVQQLGARKTTVPENTLALRARTGAGLECLTVALTEWVSDSAVRDLRDLLDETFNALRRLR
jgi:AcrR family transcriptional regulator